MHDIEPHWNWRDHYEAARDQRSPFFGRTYNEFQFSQKIYNYYIHPQWDAFGSETLYLKILYVDYDTGYAIFELIGEWNDAIGNDSMFLKRNIVDELAQHDIHKYIVLCDNVLNFHGSDECYYEEWWENTQESDGWIAFLNLLPHVEEEFREMQIAQYVHMGGPLNHINWRPQKAKHLYEVLDAVFQPDNRLNPGEVLRSIAMPEEG